MTPHCNIYTPYTEYSREYAYLTFLECANWSSLEDYKWVLFFNVKGEYNIEDLKKKFYENDFNFIFYLKDVNPSLLLLSFNKKITEFGEIIDSVKSEYTLDWQTILEKISTRNWIDFDFNKTVLLWDPLSQQSVGELIDSVTGGIVAVVPESWLCLEKDEMSSQNFEKKYSLYEYNNKKFCKWCEENNEKKVNFL